MDEFITLTEYNWTFWVAGLFALLEFSRWLFSFKELVFEKIGIKTKGMLKREEYENRLKKVEDDIVEIKHTSMRNVNMFLEHEQQVVGKFTDIKNEIVVELGKLHSKMDEQKAEMDKVNEENRSSTCIMLRDRLNSGLRYFSQNKDEDGNIHISRGDYENLEEMFQDYFSKGGNGEYKKAYKTEFQNYIIDR